MHTRTHTHTPPASRSRPPKIVVPRWVHIPGGADGREYLRQHPVGSNSIHITQRHSFQRNSQFISIVQENKSTSRRVGCDAEQHQTHGMELDLHVNPKSTRDLWQRPERRGKSSLSGAGQCTRKMEANAHVSTPQPRVGYRSLVVLRIIQSHSCPAFNAWKVRIIMKHRALPLNDFGRCAWSV